MRAAMAKQKLSVLPVVLLSFVLLMYLAIQICRRLPETKFESRSLSDEMCNKSIKEDSIDRFSRLIFVGGSIRSGTTLMRTMIESHPDIKCGPETGIIPQILEALSLFNKNSILFTDTGLFTARNDSLTAPNDAVANLMLQIIYEMNKPSKYYCNKDPSNLKHIWLLDKLFPNCKIVLMVRDFRAICQSFREKKLDENGYPTKYRDCLIYLNKLYEEMVTQCDASKNCILQKYEQLVLQPIKETQKLFRFFDIPWTEEVLKHDKHLDEIKFNRQEFTTNQVQRPLYLDGLTKWVGKIPQDVVREVFSLAPMMTKLGYDVTQGEPNYGEADDFVMKRGVWEER